MQKEQVPPEWGVLRPVPPPPPRQGSSGPQSCECPAHPQHVSGHPGSPGAPGTSASSPQGANIPDPTRCSAWLSPCCSAGNLREGAGIGAPALVPSSVAPLLHSPCRGCRSPGWPRPYCCEPSSAAGPMPVGALVTAPCLCDLSSVLSRGHSPFPGPALAAMPTLA